MLASAIALAIEVAGLIPDLIAAGKDVSGAIAAIKAIHDDPEAPTDDRWNELDAMVKADKATFEELAGKAKAGCPVSKLLNAKITLDAALVS